MNIIVQLKNIAKLLLIGAVLFVICSAASSQAVKCVSAKNSNSCQADLAKTMFARANDQIKPESPGYILVDSACVAAAAPPVAVPPKVLGAIVGDAAEYNSDSGESRKAIIEYEVEAQDTAAGLAEKFGISSQSILWANNLAAGAVLKTGQKLIIPPVTGTIHYVVAGDTMAQIAEKYKAKTENIIAFNELTGEKDIFIGDVLIVPDGEMPKPAQKKPSADTKIAQNISGVSSPAEGGLALSDNYFLCPVGAACKRTQGLHFRNAVDLTAGYCGAPIYAAASGTVAKTRIGWNGGAGNNITISHMGGAVITHYYHLQTIAVIQGQEVKKGDGIGFMGSTGKSTGCHLHFEVIGAANPFVK